MAMTTVMKEIPNTPEAAAREKKFLELARNAHTQLFEEQGETAPPDKILARVIDTDKALWEAVQPQLAHHGALALIKALITEKLST